MTLDEFLTKWAEYAVPDENSPWFRPGDPDFKKKSLEANLAAIKQDYSSILENQRLERLAKEYTERFMPAYTRAKTMAQKLSWREDIPQEMRDALVQFMMT